ncbi:RING/U-box domain-containing protein [Hibiscus syriacus]|uniref:RING/U-box domain-containing protein n=1 Tax=Hibiscus syriacus TaxID=106335 RepID=A0A6A3BCF4_HIBSY|nr:RING/U-box domain-containing protein [Hibiscus syriacus]
MQLLSVGMGLLDFLLSAEVRKSIKRKDSDAGKALEELRGSLYNELRTSEGAMSFNFFVAVAIILTNKFVTGRVGFNFPIFLTLIHYIAIFTLGAIMAFASGLANTSLKYNSVGFDQMAKIAVTPTIVLAEFILFRKTVSFKKVLALAVVSAGVAVATLRDLEFNAFGACIAIAWILPSAINKILWSNLQQANWTALALMWKTTPITIFFLVALIRVLNRGRCRVFGYFGFTVIAAVAVVLFKWNVNNVSAILVSALLGFLLQWSGALALGATSATSHVVLGQFKTCVILLGGYLLLDSDPGLVSLSGTIVALAGMSVYTLLNLKESKEGSNKQIPMQNPVSKTKTSENGNECASVINTTNEV